MSKKVSSSQIRGMIIWVGILVIAILVFVIMFLSTVDIKSTNKNSIIDSLSSKINSSKNPEVTNEVITPDDLQEASYKYHAYDKQAMMEITLNGEKATFNVIDKEKFEEKYPEHVIDLDADHEIATHDYHIRKVYLEECNGIDYFLTITEDGKLGMMDIGEAVKSNVFRIKNELISLDNGDIFDKIYASTRSSKNEEDTTTAIVESFLGQKYDLEKLMK